MTYRWMRDATLVGLVSVLLAAAPEGQPPERTTDSGLKIVETKPLKEPLVAQSGDVVWVHYTGKLQSNGEKFDSSFDHPRDQMGNLAPISFQIGKSRVIKGWHEGIVGMTVGEKRQLIIPPDLAYGAEGRGPIPPNATLVFDVQLVGIYRPEK